MASAFVKLNSAVGERMLGYTGDFFRRAGWCPQGQLAPADFRLSSWKPPFRVVSFSSVARRVWRQPRGLLFRRERHYGKGPNHQSLRSIEKAIVQILFDPPHQ